MSPATTGPAILIALLALGHGRGALAYPSAVIFAPTGETLEVGKLHLDTNVPMTFHPTVGPAPTWIGLDAGIVPGFRYFGDLRFGGLELGVDVINGASHPDNTTFLKPLFNAKVSLLAATQEIPAVGVGIMSLALFPSSEGANLAYFSTTKSLWFRGAHYGSLTMGIAFAMEASTFAFQGSPPLRGSRLALLGGYATPEWRGFALSFDTLGGLSDASGSNIAVGYSPVSGAQLILGLSFTNDRKLPRERVIDSFFANLILTIDLLPGIAEDN